jgi:anionic cell wall polymer biosynthesis LytR-Cps2A-Psr (LCP) family protein
MVKYDCVWTLIGFTGMSLCFFSSLIFVIFTLTKSHNDANKLLLQNQKKRKFTLKFNILIFGSNFYLIEKAHV